MNNISNLLNKLKSVKFETEIDETGKVNTLRYSFGSDHVFVELYYAELKNDVKIVESELFTLQYYQINIILKQLLDLKRKFKIILDDLALNNEKGEIIFIADTFIDAKRDKDKIFHYCNEYLNTNVLQANHKWDDFVHIHFTTIISVRLNAVNKLIKIMQSLDATHDQDHSSFQDVIIVKKEYSDKIYDALRIYATGNSIVDLKKFTTDFHVPQHKIVVCTNKNIIVEFFRRLHFNNIITTDKNLLAERICKSFSVQKKDSISKFTKLSTLNTLTKNDITVLPRPDKRINAPWMKDLPDELA